MTKVLNFKNIIEDFIVTDFWEYDEEVGYAKVFLRKV